jgi:hypothetical protein
MPTHSSKGLIGSWHGVYQCSSPAINKQRFITTQVVYRGKLGVVCCSFFETVGLFVTGPHHDTRFPSTLFGSLVLCFAAKLRQRVDPGFSLGFVIIGSSSRATATVAIAVSRLGILCDGSPQAEAWGDMLQPLRGTRTTGQPRTTPPRSGIPSTTNKNRFPHCS